MRAMIYNRVCGVCVVAGVVLCARIAAGAWFMPLLQLPGSTQAGDAFAVSAGGQFIVGRSHNGSGYEAVRWTLGGGAESLGAGDLSVARGISGNGGVIVGTRLVDGHGEAFRWTGGSGVVGLGDLPGGETASGGSDISADGQAVVGSSSSRQGVEPYLWNAATGMVGLGPLTGADFGTGGTAISADGSVILGNGRKTGGFTVLFDAYIWNASSGMIRLGDLPGGLNHSEVYDISADGLVAVGTSDANEGARAYRWTAAGGMAALPNVGVNEAVIRAEGVSGDGNVVVGLAEGGAFAWDAIHGSRKIADLLTDQGVDLTGWQLAIARAASHDGLTIVGLGRGADGNDDVWVARFDAGTFVAEPSGGFLAVVMLLSFAILLRIKRRIYLKGAT